MTVVVVRWRLGLAIIVCIVFRILYCLVIDLFGSCLVLR